MHTALAEVVREHRQQFESNPLTADSTLIETAKRQLEEECRAQSLEPEVMRSAEYIYDQYGDRETMLALLTRYLSQTLPVTEEAWARWHRVDHLALLRRDAEAVSAQQAFLVWAERQIPPSQWFWVMYDGTQALSWQATGKAEAWLHLFESLMARVPTTPANRFDRHLYLRTAGMLLCRQERPVEALRIAERMAALCEEETTWERALEVQMEASALEIRAYTHLQDTEHLRSVGKRAKELIEEYARSVPSLSAFEQQRLRVMCHNVAMPLYQAGEYALSIPLHQRAVALGTTSVLAYLYLAAALWATTKDRARVLPLLGKAASVSNRKISLAEINAFRDVLCDPEFIAVLSP